MKKILEPVIRAQAGIQFVPVDYLMCTLIEWHGALKNQVQHFWETMLHGKNLRAVEY